MAITPINITTSNATGAVTLSASGLPAGLSFTDNADGTGTITGTVTQGEAVSSPFIVTITATDSVATDTETFPLVVEPATLKPNAAGLTDIATATRVLDSYDCATLSANVAAGESFSQAAVVGQDLLAVFEEGGTRMLVVDISTPATPSLVSDTDLFTGTSGTVITDWDVENQILYVGWQNQSNNLSAYGIDMSTPATPTVLYGPTTVAATTYMYPKAIHFTGSQVLVVYAIGFSGKSAYLSSLSPDLTTQHVNEQRMRTDLGLFTDNGEDVFVCANGNKAWFTSDDNANGLIMVDLSSPSLPTLDTDFTNATGGNGSPQILFLPGTASGDVVVGGFIAGSDDLSVLPATGAEDGSEAIIASVTGLSSGGRSSRGKMVADLALNVYHGANAGISVLDASAPAVSFVEDVFLAANHACYDVLATNGKVIGHDAGIISIWV